MFGVVLWSDKKKNRAVIWCEDHGDLAFYNGNCARSQEDPSMDPGDLVQFELLDNRHLRVADNPRLVASEEYPTLACDLKKAGKTPGMLHDPPPLAGSSGSAKILAFEQRPPPSDVLSPPARKAI